MTLSQCIFYTGSKNNIISDCARARDMLDELFTHSDGVSELFLTELQAVGIYLPKPPIRVITITPGVGKDAFSIQHAEAFAESMMEQLPKQLRTYGIFYYINSRIQGIVSDGSDFGINEIYLGLKELVAGENGSSSPHASISNRYDSLWDISRGCEENQEAHVFARFLQKPVELLVQPKDLYLQGDEMPQDEDEEFFGQISQKICNAILAEDHGRAHAGLNEALHFMVGKFPRVSGVHMRALRFCHALEMTLVGADLIDRLFVQRFRLLQAVIEAENEVALRKTFHKKLDEICEYAQQRKNIHHGECMRQIMEYIQRNLTDSTLSISTIADNFHMTEEKLSSAFRSYFQESIPNVIHQKRVEYIKGQLLTTKKSVREICFDAGYISIATMNRAFSRLEGMYPGRYRQEYRKRNGI